MRILFALLAAAALLAGCGTETNYCVGAAADGSCQYFEAPSACSNPGYCGNQPGGYAIHESYPSGCKKVTPQISCQ